MDVIKWDGITDADLIFDALLCFIRKSDIEEGLHKSYGDFGNDIQKNYRNSFSGCKKYFIRGCGNKIEISIENKHITYELTWNKAAKLIHKQLKAKE